MDCTVVMVITSIYCIIISSFALFVLSKSLHLPNAHGCTTYRTNFLPDLGVFTTHLSHRATWQSRQGAGILRQDRCTKFLFELTSEVPYYINDKTNDSAHWLANRPPKYIPTICSLSAADRPGCVMAVYAP